MNDPSYDSAYQERDFLLHPRVPLPATVATEQSKCTLHHHQQHQHHLHHHQRHRQTTTQATEAATTVPPSLHLSHQHLHPHQQHHHHPHQRHHSIHQGYIRQQQQIHHPQSHHPHESLLDHESRSQSVTGSSNLARNASLTSAESPFRGNFSLSTSHSHSLPLPWCEFSPSSTTAAAAAAATSGGAGAIPKAHLLESSRHHLHHHPDSVQSIQLETFPETGYSSMHQSELDWLPVSPAAVCPASSSSSTAPAAGIASSIERSSQLPFAAKWQESDPLSPLVRAAAATATLLPPSPLWRGGGGGGGGGWSQEKTCPKKYPSNAHTATDDHLHRSNRQLLFDGYSRTTEDATDGHHQFCPGRQSHVQFFHESPASHSTTAAIAPSAHSFGPSARITDEDVDEDDEERQLMIQQRERQRHHVHCPERAKGSTALGPLGTLSTFHHAEAERVARAGGDGERREHPYADAEYLRFLSNERKYHHRYPQYECNLTHGQGASGKGSGRMQSSSVGRRSRVNMEESAEISAVGTTSSSKYHSWWGDGSAWRPATVGTCTSAESAQGTWLPGTIDSMYPQSHLPSFSLDAVTGGQAHVPGKRPGEAVSYLGVDDDEENQPSKRQKLDKLFDGHKVNSCVDGFHFLLRFSLFILLLTKAILITTLLIQGRLITSIDYTRLDDSDVTLIITGYLTLTIVFALIIPVPESKFHTHYITIILLNCFTLGELSLNATAAAAASTSPTTSASPVVTTTSTSATPTAGATSTATAATMTAAAVAANFALTTPIAFASPLPSVSFVFSPFPPMATASSPLPLVQPYPAPFPPQPSSASSPSPSSSLSTSSSSSSFFSSSSFALPPPASPYLSQFFISDSAALATGSSLIAAVTELTTVTTVISSAASTSVKLGSSITTAVIGNNTKLIGDTRLVDASKPRLTITSDLNLPSFAVSVFAFIYLVCLTFKFILSLLQAFISLFKPPAASHVLVLKVPPSNL